MARTTGSSRSHRVERIEFADGSAWDAAQLHDLVASLPFSGTDGDDYLNGDDKDNVMLGGAGNDWLDGGDGGDTYVFGRGDGHDTVFDVSFDPERPDVLRFGEGISEADIKVSRSGSDLVFSLDGSDDRIDVLYWQYDPAYRIERVEFADGTAWDAAMIEARIGPVPVIGSDGDDYLGGYAEAEVFAGSAGNDTIDTGGGSDVILFNRGDGQDTLYADGGADNTVSLGGGIGYADLLFSKNGNDLVLSAGAGEGITFLDWYAQAGNRSVANLQLVTDANDGATIEQFDFGGLLARFDEALLADPALGAWALSSSLLDFALHSGGDAALGGDLAVRYGTTGDLSTYSADSAQALPGSTEVGKDRQAV